MGIKQRKRLLEWGKDLVIALLAVSAVYLTLQGQLGENLALSGWLGELTGILGVGNTAIPSDQAEGQPVELRPLRMAVNLPEVGTYGVQYDSAAVDRLSDKMFTILGEALGGAESPIQTTEAVWRTALTEQSSVYFDFQGEAPLSVLYAWTEAGPGEALLGVSARRLLLAEDEGGYMTLYYSNEATGLYYACRTGDALKGHLQTVVAPYAANVNGTTFAFEHGKGEGYGKLDPYVMLSKSGVPIEKSVYRVTNPVSGGQNDQPRINMIESLGFHPQANSSYVAGGKQVVKEGTADTLVVYDSGAVEYHSTSAEEPKYPVGDGTGEPSALDLVKATQPLAERSAGTLAGDTRTAGVYLIGVTALEDGGWQVNYGYQLNGATVQLGTEGYTARFIVRDGRVSDFYLLLRSYTATEEQVSVLPELQAAAAMGALNAGGKELLLAYEDSGAADTVRPAWIAE
ncbi:conserved hypothetical protein [uncultured Eubacteriales bacterium]|uniref:Uncharacterized protein n=1 Tax=uncultured Eubacteriales bacterium TaxID=172733 RepID=A0A212J1K5_9FIRM|nr:conserved hypothetical protein [uncultured Eubacteriales bacterium]